MDTSYPNHIPHPDYNRQYYMLDEQTPSASLPSSNMDHPSYTLSHSLLQDDKALNSRLLFMWEWVFEFCFWNFHSALRTWYQILEKEDVWLWVDGDEAKGSELRLIERWDDHEGSTDLYSSCKLSGPELQRAVYILKTRLQPEHSSSLAANAPGLGRLTHQGSLEPAILRYATIALKIANSDPIQALDGARRIKGREARSIFAKLRAQFDFGCRTRPCTSSQFYDSQLKILGHSTCRSREYDDCKCFIIKLSDILGPNPNVSKRIDAFKYTQCQSCLENGPLLVSDITWDGEGPRMQDNDKPASDVPRKSLRFFWYLWWWGRKDRQYYASKESSKWVHWLASLAIHAHRPASREQRAVCLAVACLLSRQMEDWITSHLENVKEMSCLEQERIVDFVDPEEDWIYTPTGDDWKAAEASLRNAELALEPCQEPPDIVGTLGMLICWISEESVATTFPNIYKWEDAWESTPEWLYEIFTEHQDKTVRSDIEWKILDGRSGCCPPVSDEVLDLCLASATMIVSQDDITTEMVWGCRCDKSNPTDLTQYFSNYLIHNKRWTKNAVRASWEDLISMAKKQNIEVTTSFEEFRIEILDAKEVYHGGEEWSSQSDSESGEEESEERTHPTGSQKLGQTDVESVANQPDETASRNQTSPRKLSKSHQIQAIRTYLLGWLSKIESETGQIPSLLPRGKQKVSLPWKTLTQILKERGYELENWPSEVPLPGSGSELCDDNKGIHGLNAKHLRALYDATQDKERPLRFRKVRDIAPVMTRMEDAVRRQGTTRRRETSDEGEAGPIKRSRVDTNTAGPSWGGLIW